MFGIFNCRSRACDKALCKAVSNGDRNALNQLLRKGSRLKCNCPWSPPVAAGLERTRYRAGKSLLTLAVESGDSAMVTTLRAYGETSQFGMSLIVDGAINNNDSHTLRLALRAGFDFDKRHREFLTPLEQAISINSIEMIELLLELGAKPTGRFIRWFAVQGKVIVALWKSGFPVPSDCLEPAKRGKW